MGASSTEASPRSQARKDITTTAYGRRSVRAYKSRRRNQSHAVSVTMQNKGNTTWSAGDQDD